MSIMIPTMILVGAGLWSAPFWFRKDVQFGVTLPASVPADAVGRIRRRWFWSEGLALLLLGLVARGLALASRGRVSMAVLPAYFILALLVWALGWAWSHERMRALRDAATPHSPSAPREASLAPRRFADHYSLASALVAAVVLAAWCLWLARVYPELPARIAAHFDAAGQPNGWARHSFFDVFSLPLVGVMLWLLFDLITYGILHARIIAPTEAAGAAERGYRHASLQFVQWLKPILLLFLAWIDVATLRPQVAGTGARLSPAALWPPLLILFAYILAGAVWMARARLGETRAAPPGGDLTPDAQWRLGGLLYYNINDPALFVEKRSGLGWTLNFGQPRAWLFILAAILPAVVAIVLPRILAALRR